MPLFTRAMATTLVAFFSAAALSAQLSFEVASIRPSTSLNQGGTMGPKPGRFFAINVPTTAFITFGHDIKSYQLVGAPDWARTDRYNLDATTGPNANREQMREMMRSLLSQRFKLRAHRETRQLDGYALVRITNAIRAVDAGLDVELPRSQGRPPARRTVHVRYYVWTGIVHRRRHHTGHPGRSSYR